ncbi:MAG: hypothetical protein LKH27_11310 [Prevotella sp.]|jgi:hypothetical protein|nr:hypothetical protein [Prevotella sp.]MCH3969884.1 hypothetical protein [Prevotella sp.]MCH4100674.1 hypothetical protein [Prevotella sp.]MCI1474979.1 hypothetical protein [Prevotella sp.]MCI1596597.1 hypothetical protein [Prevotella sp.]MCI1686191.1 hypothetical protein [Prevotella sp.]
MLNNQINKLTSTMLFILCTITGILFQSCNNDNDYPAVDNQPPTISLTTDHIQTEPGRQFTIEGLIKDADGLKSITIANSEMFLNKTINLLEDHPDTLLHEYHLSYNYTSSDKWTDNQQFPVKITAEDVCGHTTDATVLVTPDGDFTAPTFTTVPSSEITVLKQNPKLTLNCIANDNKALSYIKVEIPGLQINDSIPTGDVKTYTLQKTYLLPQSEVSYEMTITAADKFNNKVTANSRISVSDMPDFEKMYLSDVTDVTQLSSDLFGVPMLITHTGKYQYQARYYNQAKGTQIRFIPQKTDFSPICFGIDPDNDKVLTSNPSTSKPIILNDIAYYEIDFNTVSGEYSIQEYKPTDKPFPEGQPMFLNGTSGETQPYQLSLAGENLPGAGNWSTSNPFILTQDPNNPYLFYGEMTLTAGTEISFTITPKHNWGWWPSPFYRFEAKGVPDSGENEYNTLDDGNNMTPVTVKTSGKYRFEFDTSLLRSRLYLVK